jgi:NDP-sugar pyrophosphorylase family protein
MNLRSLKNQRINEKIFILVGGLGTRLRSIISAVPKPMAPILDKPFLWYKIMQLKQVGFRRFVFLAGYLSKIIEEYFGNGSQFGIEIEYSVEKEPLGTGGALKNAEKFIDGPFFICNGDCYLDFNPIPMLTMSKKFDADYVILLTIPEIKGSYGIVVTDRNGRILQFVEKPDHDIGSPLINAGIYYFNPKIMKYLENLHKCSIERDIFPQLVNEGATFYGTEYKGYFIDIGVPENYIRFIADVEAKKILYS